MPVEMSVEKIQPSKEEIHARKQDRLRQMCDVCKQYKPGNVHDGCEIRYKLIVQDNEVAWKHEHLFISQGRCKQWKKK